MFDEVVVTRFMTDEEQLAEMCEKLDRRGAEIERQEAQLCFVNAEARWEVTKEHAAMVEANRAEERLVKLFMEGATDRAMMGKAWSAYRKVLLYHHRV